MKKYILFISIVFSSCTYDKIPVPVCESDSPSFSECILPIIETNCKSCHSYGGEGQILHLTNYDDVVNAIEDNDLLDRIQANDGNMMPPTGKMSQEDIERIIKWSDSGKKDD